ncbi:MAG TPA: acyltransferase [Verrucomicrobiae bacterium]|nr:acyltransferase [Verrucomicrobiae bacterium]
MSTDAPIPSLDGIRALAVSLVFFSHGGLGDLVPGGLGVTIFFVLSGFLITTLMRREHRASGALRLRAFYLRRLLRLMPPLLVVVAAAALLSWAGVIGGSFSPRGLLSVLFYFGNYHVIAQGYDGVPEGLGVVWSLAVEEHYYLLYPPLAIALLRLQRPRTAAAILAALCAAILVWRAWLAAHGAPEAWLSMATDTRADAILAGCVLAFASNPALASAPRATRLSTGEWLMGSGCVLLLLATLVVRDEQFRVTARYTLQSLAIAPLIWLAVARASQAPFRWLNARPLVYLGTISYTVYLSHQVVLFGVMRNAPALGSAATLAVTALLVLAVAEPMRRWVEQPCARLRRQLHRPRRTAASAPPLAAGAR